jgi:hypothetical protein
MQTIEITGATGTGPYDVYICDITLTYCFLISGSTTIPPNVYFQLPTTLTNPYPLPTTITFGDATSVVVKLVDLGTGCEKFIPYFCPSATPTPTVTQTPTQTPSNCLCNRIDNPTGEIKEFTYNDCNGILIFDSIPPSTSLFVCGTSVITNPGLILSVLGPCVDGTCPDIYLTPTPTPSITQTQTPTQTSTQTPTPTMTPTQTQPIGKLFQMGDFFIYMDGNIYIFQNQ